MERIIDLTMTHLFLVAEYVLDKCTFLIKKSLFVQEMKLWKESCSSNN